MLENTNQYNGNKQQGDFNFDDYQPLSVIYSWLTQLAIENDGVDVVNIGQSHEGRDTLALTITRAGADAPNVWIESGIHAREWIAPAVAAWLLDSLLNTDEGEAYTQELNFHILVVANPDGYDYTWTDVN